MHQMISFCHTIYCGAIFVGCSERCVQVVVEVAHSNTESLLLLLMHCCLFQFHFPSLHSTYTPYTSTKWKASFPKQLDFTSLYLVCYTNFTPKLYDSPTSIILEMTGSFFIIHHYLGLEMRAAFLGDYYSKKYIPLHCCCWWW